MAARKNPGLDELRQQAKLMEKRAAAKMARNARQNNIHIKTSELNPIKPQAKGYNEKQLKTYIKRLETFNSRKTQFEAIKNGQPVYRHEAKAFYDAVDAKNNRLNEYYDGRAHAFFDGAPLGSYVYGQRKRRTKYQRGDDYQPVEIGLKDVESRRAIKKLTKAYNTQLTPQRINKQTKSNRKSANGMLKAQGLGHVSDYIYQLDDFQLNMLWNMTDFAHSLVFIYHWDEIQDEVEFSKALWHVEVAINQAKHWNKKDLAKEKFDLMHPVVSTTNKIRARRQMEENVEKMKNIRSGMHAESAAIKAERALKRKREEDRKRRAARKRK